MAKIKSNFNLRGSPKFINTEEDFERFITICEEYINHCIENEEVPRVGILQGLWLNISHKAWKNYKKYSLFAPSIERIEKIIEDLKVTFCENNKFANTRLIEFDLACNYGWQTKTDKEKIKIEKEKLRIEKKKVDTGQAQDIVNVTIDGNEALGDLMKKIDNK